MTKRKGFTLVELLVAVGIIGVLASITAVSVGNARSKARDSKRVADVKTMQNALEIIYNDTEKYPVNTAAFSSTLAAPGHFCDDSVKLTTAGCTTKEYLKMPVNPTPNGTDYVYAISTGATYEISFTLENDTGGLNKGLRKATPTGIQ